MELYLLRHAQAVEKKSSGYSDDDRPLSEEGIGKMAVIAEGIAKIVPGFDLIFSSPLTRSLETAKIVADACNYEKKITVCQHLLPGVPTESLFMFLAKYTAQKRILLVGHEPQLGIIASDLLKSQGTVISFKKGSIACLELLKFPLEEPAKLSWYFPPKILQGIAKTTRG